MLERAKAGRSALLVAATGAGKTLAGFLPTICELAEEHVEGLHTLYVSPLKALAVDIARNLETPHALGMVTVLVVPEGQREVFREQWELEGRDAAHVDHVTENLVGFIEGLLCNLRL